VHHGTVMKNHIKRSHIRVIRDSEEHILASFGSVLSILYLGEGEGFYNCVRGDHGKSVAECAGCCSYVRKVGRVCNRISKHNKGCSEELSVYLCLSLNLLYYCYVYAIYHEKYLIDARKK